MSIKRYLFLFVATVILVISLAQILLLFQFKSNIEQEISSRSKKVADKLLNLTIESFAQTGVNQREDQIFFLEPDQPQGKPNSKNFYVKVMQTEQDEMNISNKVTIAEFDLEQKNQLTSKVLLAQHPNIGEDVVDEIVQLIHDLPEDMPRSTTIDKGKVIVEIVPSLIPITKVKKRFFKQLDKVTAETQIDHQVHRRLPPPPPKFWKHMEKRNDILLNRFFNMVVLIIIATALLSLLVVFWLSKKLSSPLTDLVNGFKALENGQLGVQVKTQGVEEIQSTITRFNSMSAKLKMLTEAEEKLKEQQHLAEVSDVTKGLAHSLRNPIHTIGLLIEQLTTSDLTEESKSRLIQILNNKITQLDKNIAALLTISSGNLDRNQTVDIYLVIQDIVLEAKQDSVYTNNTLSIELNCPKPMNMIAAESEIRSILHTLIYNALDAGKESQNNDIHVNVDVEEANSQITISVTDNGPGISSKIEDKLFQPHISTKAEGAGMGLYISQRIAKLYYNGSLTLQNVIEDDHVVGAKAICVLNGNNE